MRTLPNVAVQLPASVIVELSGQSDSAAKHASKFLKVRKGFISFSRVRKEQWRGDALIWILTASITLSMNHFRDLLRNAARPADYAPK